MKFNINDYVKVKLTEKGLRTLKKQHEELKRKAPSIGEYREPKIDREGYTKFQLWDLMSHFGTECSLGLEIPFDTEIIICDKTTEGNEVK